MRCLLQAAFVVGFAVWWAIKTPPDDPEDGGFA